MSVLFGPLRVDGRIERSSVVLLLVLVLLSIPAPAAGQWVHTKLNAPLADGEEITSFAISPDGGNVVYRLEHRYPSETPELYSVPITGGEPVRLDQPPGDGAVISFGGFQISPDSRHVIYLEEVHSDEQYHPVSARLYSVAISGGEPVRLDQPSEDRTVISFGGVQISPDSGHVVYVGTTYDDEYWPVLSRLYGVPIVGGAPVEFTPPTVPGVEVVYGDLWISADSAHLVYNVVHRATRDEPYEVELYTVPISGGTSIELVMPDESLPISQVALSADSQRVVVYCEEARLFELYSFPIRGGSPVRLSNAYELSMVSNYGSGASFLLSADGKDVIYPIWDDSRKRELMVRVPVGGGEHVELAAGTGPAQDLVLQGITADGEYIIYTGYDHTGTALYSTPIMHGAPLQLLPLHAYGQEYDVSWYLLLSPAGNSVVVRRSVDPDLDVPSLVSVSAQGGDATVLVERNRRTNNEKVSPDGSQLLYISTDYDAGDSETLYSVPMEGGTPVPIGMPITRFKFSADGRRVVYQTWQTDLYMCAASFGQYLPYLHGR